MRNKKVGGRMGLQFVVLWILLLPVLLAGAEGAPQPSSHWPMDSIQGGYLKDVVGERPAKFPELDGSLDRKTGLEMPYFRPEVVRGLYDNGLHLKKEEQGFAVVENAGTFSFENGFSVAVWVKPDRRGGFMQILSTLPDGKLRLGGYRLRVGYGTASFHAIDKNGSLVGVRTESERVRPHQWTHLGVVADGKSLKFYRNGALVDEKIFDGIIRPAFSTPTIIGNYAGITGYRHHECHSFSGVIQDLKIWERPLTTSEMQAACDASLHP